ncbi:hypothetical protein BGZ94_003350 [Podila epigama]|nr:hypothetical protein BGZ94_003350 [Podila epigama]
MSTVVTSIMGSPFRSISGPARDVIEGGYPVIPGPGVIKLNYTIDQPAPFAELMVSFQILAGPKKDQSIVCVAVLLEQRNELVNLAVGYLPLALAAYAGLVSLTSIFMRATIGNGLIGAAATYGLITEPVNVHSPGFFDIVYYAQFMVMTGQLSLNYPSFYSTFTSLFHWSFLQFRNSFAGHGPDNSSYVLTFGGAGSVNLDKDHVYYNSINNNNRKRSLPDAFDLSQYVAPLEWDVAPQAPFPHPTSIHLSTSRIMTMPHPTQAAPTIYKRQEATIGVTVEATSPAPSPSPSPSVSPSSSESTSTSSSSESSSSKTSKSSSRRSTTTSSASSSFAPISSPTQTPSPTPITPIVIRDPFDKNSNIPSKQYNVSRFGIESYAAAIGAYPSNLFLCTLINTVIAGGVALFLSALYLGIALITSSDGRQKGKTLQHALNFVAGKC